MVSTSILLIPDYSNCKINFEENKYENYIYGKYSGGQRLNILWRQSRVMPRRKEFEIHTSKN